MESVDGARSLQAVSYEICYTHMCDPCVYGGVKNKEALAFCYDCKKVLCSSCTRSHRGQRTSQNHRLLNVSDLTIGQTTLNTNSDLILCDGVQHSTVTLYCKEHGKNTYSHCKVLKPKRCPTITIEEKSESYSEIELNAVSERLARLENELDLFIHERKTDLQNIEVMKENCIDSIRHFREEFNSYLDDVHENSIKRIDTYALKEKQKSATILNHVQLL